MKYLIEGLDRLGKDTLIRGILHTRGYHQVLHFSKPEVLERYTPIEDYDPAELKRIALHAYQEASFNTMFTILRSAANVICNRAHLGECVYAPLYRGYSGDFVFELEKLYVPDIKDARLILLTENFDVSDHFVDDGESFDITKRKEEQEMFLAAFERSYFSDKRVICVTDTRYGGFKTRAQILQEAIK
jgi:thymidylate kinase